MMKELKTEEYKKNLRISSISVKMVLSTGVLVSLPLILIIFSGAIFKRS